ncbi:ATP-binding protein [Nostoc sp. C117]|uniref:PAS domain-containing sensor histidine kinase n=1 Tax=Nostoc sp. C117 TaxID=3349875 RepID=UPI00370D50F9
MMLAFFNYPFYSNSFIPHGHCYLWKTRLVWLHIISDATIAFAYYSIPLLLIYFIYKRKDIPFNGVFFLFGAFILACGTGHLMEIWTLWHPDYWIAGILKALTAIISIYTAFTLIYLIPQALKLTSPTQLEAINKALSSEIIERKKTEEALLRISKAVESVSDAIAIADVKGQSNYQNPAFIHLFGYTVDELNATGGPKAIYSNPLELESVLTTINSGQSWRGEVTMQSATGHTMQIDLRADAIKDLTGNIIALVGIHTDITERKQAEAQLKQQAIELEQTLQELQSTQSQLIHNEKMSSLGQLVAGVAHEINNPVTFIYSNLIHANNYIQQLIKLLHLYGINYPNPVLEIQEEIEAIDLDFLRDDLQKLLSSMKVGAERIGQIVASLRTFSRLDEAELKVTDIHEGIDSTLMILEHRLTTKGNYPKIQVIKDYGNLPLVECYAGQLNQVFMNILTNALDALEDSLIQGKITINKPQIRIYTQHITAQQIIIRIIDNGPGILEQVRQKLFNPFFTTKTVGKGAGLGLSISYQIITERHGGSLQCISSPNQGAEFIIQIPVKQPNK